jgi:uncharacterized delta-60 repeat protein
MRRARYAATISVLALMSLMGAGVARGATPGSLDPNFGGGVVSPAGAAQFFGVTVQSDGSVVAAGQSSGGSALVERLTGSGQADSSFGSGGQATGVAGEARAIALQSDGKIVVAGTSGGMFVERFNTNGSVDSSFGSGGVARAFAGSGIANGVAVEPDGKIVVVGSVNPIDTRVAIARFNSNGTLDTSFGSGGTETLAVFNLPYEAATAVATQQDGKIVFAGYEQGSPNFGFYNGLVVRLTSSGAYDSSFNGNGVVSYHKANSGYDTMNAVAIQNDGKIVAAGADVGGPYAIFLRINPNGSFDSGFGTSGEAALSSGNATSLPAGAYGVGIAGGGRVTGAGAVILNGADHRAGVWATSASGQPESGFGSGGVVEQQTGVEACGFAVAPDGGLVVIGYHVSALQRTNPCSGSGGSAAFVARYIGYGPPPLPAPPVSAPTVSTGPASNVTEVSADVGGTVDTNGLDTTYHVEYGQTSSYGSSTSDANVAASSATKNVSAVLRNLRPGTLYHYRLVASNSAGTRVGVDRTFKTLPSLRSSVKKVVGSYRLSTLVKRGILIKVGCNQRCSISSSLSISASIARKLKLGSHQLAIAKGTASLKRGGTTSVVIRLTKRARRAISHQHKLRVTLKVISRPVGGGHSVTFKTTVWLQS